MHSIEQKKRFEMFRRSFQLNPPGKDLGFSLFANAIVEDELAGDSEEYVLLSRNHRRIILAFSPSTFTQPDFAQVMVEDVSGRDFMLADWIRANLGVDVLETLALSKMNGSNPENYDRFLRNLNSIFQYPILKSILLGQDWSDVPFYWGDLK